MNEQKTFLFKKNALFDGANKEEIKTCDIKREYSLINKVYAIRCTNPQVLKTEIVLSAITIHTENLLNNYKNSTT